MFAHYVQNESTETNAKAYRAIQSPEKKKNTDAHIAQKTELRCGIYLLQFIFYAETHIVLVCPPPATAPATRSGRVTVVRSVRENNPSIALHQQQMLHRLHWFYLTFIILAQNEYVDF